MLACFDNLCLAVRIYCTCPLDGMVYVNDINSWLLGCLKSFIKLLAIRIYSILCNKAFFWSMSDPQ